MASSQGARKRRLDRVEERLEVLIGEGAAGFFDSARRMVAEDLGLEARSKLIWHCAREIEGSIYVALEPIAPRDEDFDEDAGRAAQCDAIIQHLELPTDDAAIAWWRKTSLHSKVHRDHLARIKEFVPAEWELFVEALEIILNHFEARYDRMLTRLDELLSETPAKAGKEASKLLCALPPGGRVRALGHFLERADERWLPYLPSCILKNPPGLQPVRSQPGYFRMLGWPASQYLAKVAPAKPKAVHQRVMEILARDPENPHIHRDFVAAAAHFPPKLAADWAKAEAVWVRRQKVLMAPIGHYLIDGVENLASSGNTDAAFDLGTAVLELGDVPTGRYGDPSLRMNDYYYEQAFAKISKALVALDPVRACEALAPLVEAGAAQAHPNDSTWGSRMWLTAVEDHPRQMSPTVTEQMVVALRDALDAAATDAAALRAMVALLRSRPPGSRAMERLAIHLVRVKRKLDPSLAIGLLAVKLPRFRGRSAVRRR